MSDTPFHQTRMGHTFYEGTMPALVRELQRLNDNIERMLAAVDRGEKAPAPVTPRSDATEHEQ